MVEEAEAMADSDDDRDFGSDFSKVEDAELKLETHFKDIMLDKDGVAASNSLTISHLFNYLDKKINKQINNGVQYATKIVLKKSIKFCDQRMQFLIQEQNERIQDFELRQEQQFEEIKKKFAAVE